MCRIVRLFAASLLAPLVLLAGCASDDPDGVSTADTSDESTEEPGDGDTGEIDESEDEAPGSSEEGTAGDEDAGSDGEPESIEEAGEHADQWVAVFLVRDVEGYLWVESEERRLDEGTEAVARAAMTQLFTGEPNDPGLVAPAGTGVEVLDVNLDDTLLTVDVSDDIYDAATGAAGEGMFRQALAHTGAQFDSVRSVELRVEGEPITELWGHIDWSDPATPDPHAQAPIDVDRPRYGETWPPGHVTVMGTSLTFESTVEIDLIAPGGEVAEEGFTTAQQESADRRGPFEHTFETEATQPGEWVIRVREPDPSDGEGRPAYTADIAITIE